MSPLDEADPTASPAADEAPSEARLEARRRRRWAVAGGVVGLLVAAAIGWWTIRNEAQRITATTTSYHVDSDTSVTVGFDVTRPPGLAVTCTVQAINGSFTVVGSADVVVPSEGDRTVHLEKAVRTTTRAVTGVVDSCVRS